MALNYSIDGNQVCATGAHFQCLATCHAGFGDSLELAFKDYYKDPSRPLPLLRDCREWEKPWRSDLERERTQ